MGSVLILGGTRNLGHFTALELLRSGHHVTVLNRGLTRDSLPPDVERLRADRSDTAQLRGAVGSRSFDLVLDNTTYTAEDARQAVTVFPGKAGRYVFISSGQVYLVRENLPRPFHEEDYDGPLMRLPAPGSPDQGDWRYGMDKRDAEEVFTAASKKADFPVTTLRLPMVASERDHYGRIQAYVARILDGDPLLLPAGEGLPLRHIYVQDVALLVSALVNTDAGIARSYNISCGSSMTLAQFIDLLARITGRDPLVLRPERAQLESAGLLPHCSPFSGKWMSELDNRRSLEELSSAGLAYTSPEEYMPAVVKDYERRWHAECLVPNGYAQRDLEASFRTEVRFSTDDTDEHR